jgi:hypothetical protein
MHVCIALHGCVDCTMVLLPVTHGGVVAGSRAARCSGNCQVPTKLIVDASRSLWDLMLWVARSAQQRLAAVLRTAACLLVSRMLGSVVEGPLLHQS